MQFSSGLSRTSYSPSSGSLITVGSLSSFSSSSSPSSSLSSSLSSLFGCRGGMPTSFNQMKRSSGENSDHAGITRADPRRFRTVSAAGKPRNGPGYPHSPRHVAAALRRYFARWGAIAEPDVLLRQVAGGTPKARLNARLKAASDSYPTCSAMRASGVSLLRN